MKEKEEQTDNQRAIEKLKENINKRKKTITAEKFMITQLKNAEKKPFAEGKVMRSYLHTVRFLTKSFRNINMRAEEALENPTGLRRTGMLQKAKKILNACDKIKEVGNNKARAMATEAAMTEMELQSETLRGLWEDGESIVTLLKKQVARLRVPADKEQAKEDKRKSKEFKDELAGQMDALKELVQETQA